MDNLVLVQKNKEVEELSSKLGFSSLCSLENIKVIAATTPRELLRESQQAKGKLVVFTPTTEDLLRFALERTNVKIVYGLEKIHPQNHTHYVRGGLDQVLCTIAAEKGKIMGFSFAELLQSRDRAKLLARMRANIALCQKYKVKMFWGNFSTSALEMRSAEDLFAFWKLLSGKSKQDLML